MIDDEYDRTIIGDETLTECICAVLVTIGGIAAFIAALVWGAT